MIFNKSEKITQFRHSEQKKYNSDYFKNEYWKEDLPNKIGNRGLSYNDPDHKLRFTFLCDLLQKHFKFNRIIDAGCGSGQLVEILSSRGIFARGFDISLDGIDKSNIRLATSIKRCGINAIQFPSSSFEIVFCSDVLEHIPIFDINDAILELIRVSNNFILVTINTNNPYEYHPTILSRSTWETIFLNTGLVNHDLNMQNKLQEEAIQKYSEYEFFVFRKRVN